MLKFVTGRLRSGKTTYIHKEIEAQINSGRTGITLIVPEQFSFATEKAMLKQLGAAKYSQLSVLSFSRLADTLVRPSVYAGRQLMSDSSKSAVMALALDSVKDELGENKLKKIQDNATAKLIEENPVNPEEIINTGDGDDLFMDYYSKRYFRSCTKAINTRYNHFIARLQHEDYMTPNDWLYEMDLPRICPELGDCKYFTSAMYQSKLLDDEPEYTYGPGPFGAPCGIVKMSCEPSFERY